MSSTLDEIYARKKKDSGQAKIAEAQRKRETEELMKGLGLSEEEYQEFLEKRDSYNPSLYDVNVALDDDLVGEVRPRMSIVTSFVLAKDNVYVSGPSASGKSACMQSAMNLLLPGDIVVLEGSSERQIFEMEREIKKARYIIIHEINKINAPLTLEVLKSFGEQKEFVYRRAGGIAGKGQEFRLPPRPFMFSRADESSTTNYLGPEIMSRLTEISVDSSKMQTLAVLSRQASGYLDPFAVNKVNMVDRACLRYHISSIPDFDVVVNPGAPMLIECIPTTFTTSRREYPRYIRNCAGICKFFHKDRIKGIIDGKSVIFTSISDLFMNHMVFGENLIQSSLRCNDLQRTIMKVLNDEGQQTKQEIQQQLRYYSLNHSLKVVESHLNHLNDLGYVSVERIGRENVFSMSTFYSEFDIIPDFNAIVDFCVDKMKTIDYYKPFSDEYISRFCDKSNLKCINPFDGSEIDILKWNFKSVLDVVDEATTRIKHVEEDVRKTPVNLTDFM